MKIYLDVHKEKGIKYIEDIYSSSDIISTSKDEFVSMIKSFGNEVHSCYSPFINHIGRFHRDYGKDWFGDNVEVYANEMRLELEKQYNIILTTKVSLYVSLTDILINEIIEE